ncbi:catechol 2,3-dioxygenase-like lactoylglutathione lyase family enzyme [Agromyces hippuratus]|uniref:Catechol 2,3-dioxygenase-like lactoylglutathione lyase family enzyme n=1 Tax=Agromyces hippuratus TaxID=286438 RepID=A0A852X0U0_9MICO|nr:FosX/FosE/FosI family fosfomycin resistance hydrolase [Agromyces hippuratus]NYG19761.1 catechol 2,3-dioxygenase-like lactoylglutathione lyase family enzyme [Agromyces hippuratus]
MADTTPRIGSSGLSHVTFIVTDLDRMETILTRVLGAVRVYDSGAETFSLSEERFFLIGDEPTATWVAIMQGDGELPRSYNHVAFQVGASALDELRRIIDSLGLEQRPPRARVRGEGESIYFYDDDAHLFELHTGSLRERLSVYASETTRS